MIDACWSLRLCLSRAGRARTHALVYVIIYHSDHYNARRRRPAVEARAARAGTPHSQSKHNAPAPAIGRHRFLATRSWRILRHEPDAIVWGTWGHVPPSPPPKLIHQRPIRIMCTPLQMIRRIIIFIVLVLRRNNKKIVKYRMKSTGRRRRFVRPLDSGVGTAIFMGKFFFTLTQRRCRW